MEALARLLGIAIGVDNLLVLQDVAALAGLVDLHQVLVNYAAGADVEVSHLRVTHLSVGQTYVLTASVEL